VHPRDWNDGGQGEGREFLREATQVKNIWIPYGEKRGQENVLALYYSRRQTFAVGGRCLVFMRFQRLHIGQPT